MPTLAKLKLVWYVVECNRWKSKHFINKNNFTKCRWVVFQTRMIPEILLIHLLLCEQFYCSYVGMYKTHFLEFHSV